MAKGSKEFKIGLFAALMVAALYIGFNYLRGLDVFSPQNTYYVKYQNVRGLNKGNRIILNGLDVGSVVSIQFSDDSYNEIIVTIAIDKTIKLTDSTVAKLTKPGLIGASQIQLIMKEGGTQVLKSGMEIKGDVDKNLTELLTEEGSSVTQSLLALVSKINDVLAPFANKANTISQVIDNFKQFSGELAGITRESKLTLTQLRPKLGTLSDSLLAAMGSIKPLLTEYQQLGQKLNAIDIENQLIVADSILNGTQHLLKRLNSGDGTLGKLISNDSLYSTLTRTMADLDSLLIDLRYNPKRYIHFSIFGRKNKLPAKSRGQ